MKETNTRLVRIDTQLFKRRVGVWVCSVGLALSLYGFRDRYNKGEITGEIPRIVNYYALDVLNTPTIAYLSYLLGAGIISPFPPAIIATSVWGLLQEEYQCLPTEQRDKINFIFWNGECDPNDRVAVVSGFLLFSLMEVFIRKVRRKPISTRRSS